MNLATLTFTAILRNTCRGCLCEHERMTVCNAVGQRAEECGLPACDASSGGHIYVIAGSELFGMVEQQSGATADAISRAPKQ
jgi:hypothetical protein